MANDLIDAMNRIVRNKVGRDAMLLWRCDRELSLFVVDRYGFEIKKIVGAGRWPSDSGISGMTVGYSAEGKSEWTLHICDEIPMSDLVICSRSSTAVYHSLFRSALLKAG